MLAKPQQQQNSAQRQQRHCAGSVGIPCYQKAGEKNKAFRKGRADLPRVTPTGEHSRQAYNSSSQRLPLRSARKKTTFMKLLKCTASEIRQQKTTIAQTKHCARPWTKLSLSECSQLRLCDSAFSNTRPHRSTHSEPRHWGCRAFGNRHPERQSAILETGLSTLGEKR